MPALGAPLPKDSEPKKQFDFVYVASGDPHKNHKTLLAAWALLAQEVPCPTLAVTIDPNLYPELAGSISNSGLPITTLGALTAEKIHHLYPLCGALIFPSYSESFGLSLLEAARHQLPILASELDFVRDVVAPVQTFNPHSARSIARAVHRFLGRPTPTLAIQSAEDLWRSILPSLV
jgi:glycosyltransferase involved in cell wall biosynthesis